jgi:hypothetical protein
MPRPATLVLLAVLSHAAPAAAEPAACPAHLATIEPDGRASEGSKDAVRNAVSAGLPLRVGWGLDVNADGRPEISHWADAGFVSDFEGDVFAQVHDIQRQTPQRDPARIPMPAGRQRWSGLVGTNGLLESHFDDGQPPRSTPVRSTWCVDPRASACAVPQWRLVFHNDAQGDTVQGSRSALAEAIRRGQPLRVAWGFAADTEGRRLTLEHSAEPVFVSLLDGVEVVAQLPEHVAQAEYHRLARATFDEGSVLWRGLLRSDGVFDAVWVDRGTGREVRRLPQRARIAWFAFAPDPACAPPPAELAVAGGVVRR